MEFKSGWPRIIIHTFYYPVISVFQFWSGLKFVKLVKGKRGHQYDITLVTSSKRTTRSYLVPHVFITLNNLTNSTWSSKSEKNHNDKIINLTLLSLQVTTFCKLTSNSIKINHYETKIWKLKKLPFISDCLPRRQKLSIDIYERELRETNSHKLDKNRNQSMRWIATHSLLILWMILVILERIDKTICTLLLIVEIF